MRIYSRYIALQIDAIEAEGWRNSEWSPSASPCSMSSIFASQASFRTIAGLTNMRPLGPVPLTCSTGIFLDLDIMWDVGRSV